ncbi:MAG: Jag N-terminal domain-containing protein [Zetaproteobacteria bacterium]|nr:Jag N-terminal domain-containing protein [Zetaproteobacteria bacterium]
MSIQVEEKSLQLALVKAAGKLGITQDQLKYKIVSKNSGFLGIFGKKVAIEAWSTRSRSSNNQGVRRGASRGSASSQEPVELTKSEIQKVQQELKKFCSGLAKHVTGSDVRVTADLQEDKLVINIEDETIAAFAKKNPRLIESFEHLLRKQPIILGKELPFRLFVDANRMRQDREAELINVAKDLSEKVSQNLRPIVLNYRSSYDRKVIHMALDQDERVYTKSIGSGANRKLMILPRREGEESEPENSTNMSL